MNYRKLFLGVLFLMPVLCLVLSCNNEDTKKPVAKDIVKKPEQMEERLSDDIKKMISYASEKKGFINDSERLQYLHLDSNFYTEKDFEPIWSNKANWLPLGDSLFVFIDSCKDYGLFPSDYHYKQLSFIRRVLTEDSIARKNAALWTRADVLLTDAFFTLVKDIKHGRFNYDSVTLRKDSVLNDSFFVQNLKAAMQSGTITETLHSLEPKNRRYDSLKIYTKKFLAGAKFKAFTYLEYPYKDSIAFFKTLQKRLFELSFVLSDSVEMDTTSMKTAIRKFQKARNFQITGKVNEKMVNVLNETDIVKFKRIAVNLDRYKQLPDSLPATYAWVNLPAFQLQVMNNDTVVFESRVIVGKPDTRTPLLTSEISNFITFPQWTVPTSIIFKEMLPKIQKSTDFLKKENLMVVDKDDNVLDPEKINWKKLNKNHFPYLLKQQQGDNNSLGVIKFNFRNKYSVYMHDTNVRWMFGKAFRALSHGCVRVKEWEKLSDYLVRNDTVRYNTDTLRSWIKRQEKHAVSGFQKLPVFLRYFDCEGVNGQVRFYDDIYGEDKFLREKYFADKAVN
jgi:murein L,D-transpeptidase YcbB/YkuD